MRQHFPDYSAQCLMNSEFSNLAEELVNTSTSSLLGSFLQACADQYSNEYSENPSMDPLSMQLSFLQSARTLQTLTVQFSLDSHLHYSTQPVHMTLLQFSLKQLTSFVSHFLGITVLHCLTSSIMKTVVSCLLTFLSCFIQLSKFSPCYSNMVGCEYPLYVP